MNSEKSERRLYCARGSTVYVDAAGAPLVALVTCVSDAEAEKHTDLLNTMTRDLLLEVRAAESDRDRALKLVYPELSGFARPVEAYEHANGKHTEKRSKDCRVCQGIVARGILTQKLDVARRLLKKLEWALPDDYLEVDRVRTPWLKSEDIPRSLRMLTMTQGEIHQLKALMSDAKSAPSLGTSKVSDLLEALLDDIEVMHTSQHEDAIQACAQHAKQLIETFIKES